MGAVYKRKSMGGLGLKDLRLQGIGLKDQRLQGISLVVKWIAKASVGEEPWKILIRHNLRKRHFCGENL